MKKRGLIISDTHCGHRVGLTPPSFQRRIFKNATTKRNKWAKMSGELWEAFHDMVDRNGPYDFGLDIGDAVDGPGSKSGGTELIEPSMAEQVDMAVSVRDHVRLHAKKGFQWVGVNGTAYHTTKGGEDWDNLVADKAGYKKMGSHEWVNVSGCIFDLKHHIGGSTIPHGRHTAAAKERLWNGLWAERGLVPRARVILRGHVHYHAFCGGPEWVAMTCPALQGMGSKFGGRICSGLVDFGIVVVEVDEHGEVEWKAETVQIKSQQAKAVKL